MKVTLLFITVLSLFTMPSAFLFYITYFIVYIHIYIVIETFKKKKIYVETTASVKSMFDMKYEMCCVMKTKMR